MGERKIVRLTGGDSSIRLSLTDDQIKLLKYLDENEWLFDDNCTVEVENSMDIVVP
jgi:hypothetical protein